jgi:C-terminal processing protease CtpA/Prc
MKAIQLRTIYRLVVIFFLACLFFEGRGISDIVYTDTGIIEGVVVEEAQDKIIISIPSGNKEIERKDIKNIEYSDSKDNLVFLAEMASNNKDYAKAYYLYEKILMLDPDFSKAKENIKKIEPYIVSHSGQKDWELSYEHFQRDEDSVSGATDTLSNNAQKTEKLMQEFGLVLGRSTGRIIVRESFTGGKAYSSGVRANDYFKNINGKNTYYVGLFDAVNTIVESERVNLVIERQLQCWIPQGGAIYQASTSRIHGLDLLASEKGIFVLSISEDSIFKKAGLSKSDIIVSIDGIDCGNVSTDKMFDIFQKKQGGYVYLIINRLLHIN